MQQTLKGKFCGDVCILLPPGFTRFEDCSLTSNYWHAGVDAEDTRGPSIQQSPALALVIVEEQRRNVLGKTSEVQNLEAETL